MLHRAEAAPHLLPLVAVEDEGQEGDDEDGHEEHHAHYEQRPGGDGLGQALGL